MPLQKRYLYALLFGVPGFFIAGISSLFVFGGLAGIFWLFIFGDNPWPSFTQTALAVLGALTFLILWIGSLIVGYRVGQRLEADPASNWMHILLSAGLTALFILFILFQQWSVGNVGPKSEGVLCSDYCFSEGYSASGLPSQDSATRTCSCYDDAGNEALQVPVENLHSDIGK